MWRGRKANCVVGEGRRPALYTIAAHRGFADALVAGLLPRYSEDHFGLARLTLLLPSARAQRTVREAFTRLAGKEDQAGLLLPRMVVVGDLDLDQSLGTLLDPLGVTDIPPAIDGTERLFILARIIRETMDGAPAGASLLRLARDAARTIDRLLIEEVNPRDLLDETVVELAPNLSAHWQAALGDFARLYYRWEAEREQRGVCDAAARRNMLFRLAADSWKRSPPPTPIVAAGITSASPGLARLLRTVGELPQGAVIIPDLDLSLDEEVWDELGSAHPSEAHEGTPFGSGDQLTHPQYHLKLLLNRMGVARDEVSQWHRKGVSAAPPERSHAISNLFLPPVASQRWVDLPSDKRRMSGVRMMEVATTEDEAQAIAVLVREALEEPSKRVAVVTPDRSLAQRIVNHLDRWNIVANDSAGRPLSDTAAGRVFLSLADVLSHGARPVELIALLAHPLVNFGMDRLDHLSQLRKVEREMRGPAKGAGLEPLQRAIAASDREDAAEWFAQVEEALEHVLNISDRAELDLCEVLGLLAKTGERLCGTALWSREDGRALSAFVDTIRQGCEAGFAFAPIEAARILREAMEEVAVRPPYGGHSRVQVLGLLESRMNRADLVVCAGLNEGTWPATPSPNPLLAPPVLRALGVPGEEYRIGLAAHDLASALGAPEVVLTRAARDAGGPTIPSRFLLRVQALLGSAARRHVEQGASALAEALVSAPPAPPYPRPAPKPSAKQRRVPISATALDRLLGDPYQFYAQSILGLRDLDALDAEPSAAWQGTVAHEILERWHKARAKGEAADIDRLADRVLEEEGAAPLLIGLWRPRLVAALRWVTQEVDAAKDRAVVAVEAKGRIELDGVTVHGRADRLDRLASGGLAIIDYKTGKPPSAAQVAEGFALQLGVLGIIADRGGFDGIEGPAERFEYWSLAKAKDDNPHGFGYVETPVLEGRKRVGIEPERFVPHARAQLDRGIARYINGSDRFTARENPDYPAYDTYDQLMRLAEWLPRLDEDDAA